MKALPDMFPLTLFKKFQGVLGEQALTVSHL
jgi:hypothetical protein